IPHISGIKVEGHGAPIVKIVRIIMRLPDSHLTTLVFGIGCILLLIAANRFLPRGIGPFVLVILSTLLVFAFRMDHAGLAIVGTIPQGLPSFSLPGLNSEQLLMLLPGALSIAFIGYIESMAVAKLIASKQGYSVVPNRELTSLGLANIVTAVFSGYPVTGGFSRSAVNNDAGAHTGVSSLITALVVLLTLVFLTPLFFYMPKATLATIVIISVSKLVDLREGLHLFRVQKTDGLAFYLTFLTTLGVGVEEGIVTGLVFSLGMYLWRSSQPYIAELGWVAEEKIFRDIRRYPDAFRKDTILFIRVEGPLFFANLKFLEDRISAFIKTRAGLELIVLDLSGVFYLDAVAVKRLEQLILENTHRGIETHFSRVRGEIREVFKRAGWQEKQFMEKFHITNIELLRLYQKDVDSL
ncbi:STAS domain-containing protein, partial [bacterium]|nr:STAS domain-containing protein [bacterium]